MKETNHKYCANCDNIFPKERTKCKLCGEEVKIKQIYESEELDIHREEARRQGR